MQTIFSVLSIFPAGDGIDSGKLPWQATVQLFFREKQGFLQPFTV